MSGVKQQSEAIEDFFGVLGGLYFRPNPFDAAIGADQESDAVDALVFNAHEFLFAPNAVGVNDGLVFVGEQREGEVKLFDEFIV